MLARKILVVDDDEMNLNIARMILERKLKSCKVLTADNGIEALEILRAEKVSLVLLDIMMPEFDGMETLAEIRADKRIKNVAVMMLTATVEKDLVQKAMALGVRDYIKKPFLPADFITRVERKLAEIPVAAEVLLIGDDEKTLQDMQKVIEENFAHEVTIATTPEEISSISTASLIIAPGDMKFADGIKYLSLIASAERFNRVPFALTTADKLLELLEKLSTKLAEESKSEKESSSANKAAEVKTPDAEKKKTKAPVVEEVAESKVASKGTKDMGKVVTTLIGYDLDIHI